MTREVRRCDCGFMAAFEFDDGHQAFCQTCFKRYVDEAVGNWDIPVFRSVEDIVKRLEGES